MAYEDTTHDHYQQGLELQQQQPQVQQFPPSQLEDSGMLAEDHRLTLFIASSSIIILTLILIIAVVSCFILCNQEKVLSKWISFILSKLIINFLDVNIILQEFNQMMVATAYMNFAPEANERFSVQREEQDLLKHEALMTDDMNEDDGVLKTYGTTPDDNDCQPMLMGDFEMFENHNVDLIPNEVIQASTISVSNENAIPGPQESRADDSNESISRPLLANNTTIRTGNLQEKLAQQPLRKPQPPHQQLHQQPKKSPVPPPRPPRVKIKSPVRANGLHNFPRSLNTLGCDGIPGCEVQRSKTAINTMNNKACKSCDRCCKTSQCSKGVGTRDELIMEKLNNKSDHHHKNDSKKTNHLKL